MEFDPETNTYTSNGPRARAADAERDIQRLKRAVKDLTERLERLEAQQR